MRRAADQRRFGGPAEGRAQADRSCRGGAREIRRQARDRRQQRFLDRVGKWAQGVAAGLGNALAFIGSAAISFGRLFTGKAQFRGSDLALVLQETGAQALPIVSLISFLVGVILAFVGALQLQLFGAQIFVANLVAIGMTREMGAMMAAIIMAGRTGAAFAAQIGTHAGQ